MQFTTNIEYKGMTERFVGWLCSELDINPSFVMVEGQHVVGGSLLGMCIDEDVDRFIVIVKTGNRTVTDIFVTIAHEMIHVKQHIKQGLGDLLQGCEIPYMERWWEIEAFQDSVKYVERFAKMI